MTRPPSRKPQHDDDDQEPSQQHQHGTPMWVAVWWPPVARLAAFIVGAQMATAGRLPEHVWAGAAIMLASAGLMIARWPNR